MSVSTDRINVYVYLCMSVYLCLCVSVCIYICFIFMPLNYFLSVQVLARKEVYVLVYCLVGMVQGMFFTYTVSVISTIEKRFKLTSKQTGKLWSSFEHERNYGLNSALRPDVGKT